MQFINFSDSPRMPENRKNLLLDGDHCPLLGVSQLDGEIFEIDIGAAISRDMETDFRAGEGEVGSAGVNSPV